MRQLYHLPIDPACRKARMALGEKKLDYTLVSEKIWERRDEFLRLNPAGEVPVLSEPDGVVVVGAGPIGEYLEEVYPDVPLLGGDPAARAETRRLVAWFEEKFDREVTRMLVDEKVMKRFLRLGEPNMAAIRAGLANIHHHLSYISWLVERRRWLAGDDLSLADLTAAAQLSAIDYLGDVPWDEHPDAKDWYVRMKSRPAMRPILADLISGIRPPLHYADLDF